MGWPLYKKHGHAYEAFRRCVASDEEAKLIFAEFGLSESVRKPGACPIALRPHRSRPPGWACTTAYGVWLAAWHSRGLHLPQGWQRSQNARTGSAAGRGGARRKHPAALDAAARQNARGRGGHVLRIRRRGCGPRGPLHRAAGRGGDHCTAHSIVPPNAFRHSADGVVAARPCGVRRFAREPTPR